MDNILHKPSSSFRRPRRLLFGLIAAAIVTVSGVVFLSFSLKPVPQETSEIFQGVFLKVEEVSNAPNASGKVMTVEVHWDVPGVRIENRPFDYEVRPEDLISPHYDLEFADIALRRTGAAVLMNTNLYHPGGRLESLPGRPVRSLETVIVEGLASHVHEHSYLLYWDDAMDARMLLEKPPAQASLEHAILGLGLQGVQVKDGLADLNALDDEAEAYPRTFIGIDPRKRVLYLMAFENATGRFVIERAIQQGVVFGGQLDSGDSTNLLIGKHAKGIVPHAGIRSLRPLGPYLTIHAAPL